MLDDVLNAIWDADAQDLENILRTAPARYGELFPGWELSLISVEKEEDRGAQLDRMIAILNQMKEMQKKPSPGGKVDRAKHGTDEGWRAGRKPWSTNQL